MRPHSNRVSLRASFVDVLSKRSLVPKKVNRLKGSHFFRVVVQRVLENIEWFTEEPAVEEIGDDVAVNLRLTEQKKVEKKVLVLKDRSVLLTNPEERTSVEKSYIFELFNKFEVFRKYPDSLREAAAEICIYQYLKPGRVIVRQDREAENLYFILSGEVSLSKVVTDQWTGESKEIEMGILNPGDIFGEVALLHQIPRSATVITKTIVDLILIPSQDFDTILRDHLRQEWDVLQDALVHFNYFKEWDQKTIRECCILSRLKDFEPDQVLLGDGKGMVNYVHFLLDGQCRLIEHMLVRKKYSVHGEQYELYNPETSTSKNEKRRSSEKSYIKATGGKSNGVNYEHRVSYVEETASEHDSIDYTAFLQSSKAIDKRADLERSSIITTTLLDVINEWHTITDVTEMLMRDPSTLSQQCYPSDVHTIFMQICTFHRGACFGLGENMVNRRIVSTSHVRCFLIPRYWLYENNRANIWERVKLFIDSKFPTKEKLFTTFDRNRKWTKYKKNLVSDIRKQGRCIFSNVTVHDVPYAIRIINGDGTNF